MGIAEAEFRYLEETDHGNIVKGFEGYDGDVDMCFYIFPRFLHFRFSAQNRKTRVRSKDRIFSRSSLTAPLPEEEEMPFQTQQRTMDAVIGMATGRTVITSVSDALLSPTSEDKLLPVPPTKRRRNTVAGGIVETPPSTPASVTKREDSAPASTGAAKRTSKRRKDLS